MTEEAVKREDLNLEDRVLLQKYDLKGVVEKWNETTQEYLDMVRGSVEDVTTIVEYSLGLEYPPIPLTIEFASEQALSLPEFQQAAVEYRKKEFVFRSSLVIALYNHLWDYLELLDTAADVCVKAESGSKNMHIPKYQPRGVSQNIFAYFLKYRLDNDNSSIYETEFAKKSLLEIRQLESLGPCIESSTKAILIDMIDGEVQYEVDGGDHITMPGLMLRKVIEEPENAVDKVVYENLQGQHLSSPELHCGRPPTAQNN